MIASYLHRDRHEGAQVRPRAGYRKHRARDRQGLRPCHDEDEQRHAQSRDDSEGRRVSVLQDTRAAEALENERETHDRCLLRSHARRSGVQRR